MALTKDSAHRKDLTSGIGNMEHRHFATIATIIRETENEAHKQYMAETFAARLSTTNPNFDKRRFLLACGAVIK